jgi:hypothetical protein
MTLDLARVGPVPKSDSEIIVAARTKILKLGTVVWVGEGRRTTAYQVVAVETELADGPVPVDPPDPDEAVA